MLLRDRDRDTELFAINLSTDAAREIGRPEMHEDHVVCTFVLFGEPTGECVDPMFVDVPAERSTWHALEPSAVRIGPFDATSTPQRRRNICHELGVVKHGGRPVHCHVDVATNEVDVESHHVRVQSLEERRGGIALLGDNVVQVNSPERDRCR